MKRYLAIDIGASSGRHIVGWMEKGKIETQEVYRFANGVVQRDGHLVWDIEAILYHVEQGIMEALNIFHEIESLSIDTWGVDYVLMQGEQEILPCYAYRDIRTSDAIHQVHKQVPFEKLYQQTGIQYQPFNTIYQLYADKESGRLEKATDFLLIPEYLMYKLTGTKSHEYTNATTTGLVDTITAQYSQLIINELDLPKRLFQPLQKPGTVVGEYKGIKVVLCATHDTGSAVEGIPVTDNVPYISSGTWSLLGVKSHEAIHDSSSRETNWSNEGGVGYIRYQKNIMGMWLVNRLRDELCPGKDWQMIIAEAATSQYSELVDANGQVFLSPTSMRAAFDSELQTLPSAPGDYFRCAYRSLAFSYAQAIRELETNTGKEYSALYLVGGGAKNAFLNQLIEEATGMQVIALPIEATAIGNLKVQMEVEK